MTQKNSGEFENFDRTMRQLMKIPHSEIKAALDAEKAEKEKRPKKRGRPLSRPSDRVSSGKD
jgi:hypothetical protein